MDLGSNELANLVSYISLVVSGILAICYIRDRRNAKYSIENEYTNNLLKWHADVISVLIKLRSDLNSNSTEKKQLLLTLSSLIEQGRFYFPNIKPDQYGVEKPLAYRGYRNIALDFLVASYNLHNKESNQTLNQQAEYLQRLFTSVVFDVVSPSDRLKLIHKLTDKYFDKNMSIENLEDLDQIKALSHMWSHTKP